VTVGGALLILFHFIIHKNVFKHIQNWKKKKKIKKNGQLDQLRNHRLLLAQTRPKMHQISQAEFGPNPPNAGRPALMPNGNN
jgi:hypothetical protein